MASSPKFSDSSHTLLWKLALCCTEGGGGSGAGVSSFNGQTGDVVLSFADVVAALGCEPECVANRSNDPTMAANSATLYPTQQAARGYADTKLALTGGILTGDLDISTGIHLDTTGDAQFDGQVTAERLLLTGATFAVAAEHLIDSAVTWAGPGQAFTAWRLNVTNTFSSAASLLLDLQVGGVSRFSVSRDGNFSAFGNGSIGGTLDMTSGFIVNVLDPVNPQDAATKIYVDTAVAGAGAGVYVLKTGDTMSGDLDIGTAIHLDSNPLAFTTFAAGALIITGAGSVSFASGSALIDTDGSYSAGGGALFFSPTAESTFATGAQFNLSRLRNVGAPVDPDDAATKSYVDGLGAGYQPLDADLTAIAALATTGFAARTAANTWALRTLTGTPNQVIITNGAGVAGNPVFSLPQDIHTTATPQFLRLGLGNAASGTLSLLTSAGITVTAGNLTMTAGNIDLSGSAPTIYQTGAANSLRVGMAQPGAQFQFFGNSHASLAGQMFFDAGTGDVFFRFPGPGLAFGMTLRTTGRVELTGTAVAFDVYNVRTSATNFERLTANWSANVARLWTEKGSGGGTARALVLGADATELMRFGSATTLSFFAATAVVKQTSGANLTNNVTAGGTDDTIANFTDLTTYANDAAAIRNDIYQLARKVKQLNDGLRSYGLFT